MDSYNLTPAARRIEEFVDSLSNWYVRRNRRRFWKSENDADKLAAYTTLYQCLVTLSRLLAPFMPFIAEELYQNLLRSVNPEAKESVHLTDFPIADETKINDKLNSDVGLARRICSLGRAARAKAGIKVRQPVAKILVKVSSGAQKKALTRLQSEVLEELNAKQLEIVEDMPVEKLMEWPLVWEGGLGVMLSTEISSELIAEGLSRELVRHLQNMRRNAKFDITDHIVTYYQTKEPLIKQAINAFASYIKQETLSQELIDALPPVEAYNEKRRISDSDVFLAVKKANPKS